MLASPLASSNDPEIAKLIAAFTRNGFPGPGTDRNMVQNGAVRGLERATTGAKVPI